MFSSFYDVVYKVTHIDLKNGDLWKHSYGVLLVPWAWKSLWSWNRNFNQNATRFLLCCANDIYSVWHADLTDYDNRILKLQEEEEEKKRQRRERKKEKKVRFCIWIHTYNIWKSRFNILLVICFMILNIWINRKRKLQRRMCQRIQKWQHWWVLADLAQQRNKHRVVILMGCGEFGMVFLLLWAFCHCIYAEDVAERCRNGIGTMHIQKKGHCKIIQEQGRSFWTICT
jgi:hypothetical protein